jgi:hypothetical protein
MAKKLIVVLFLCLMPAVGFATVNVYVDPDCETTTYVPATESCSGGSDRVYDTIQEAVDWVVNSSGQMGSDTIYIYIMDGTYSVPYAGGENIRAGVDMGGLDGTTTYPIYFRAYNINTTTDTPNVKIQWNTGSISSWQGNPALLYLGHLTTADNVIIEGLELYGRGRTVNNDGIGYSSGDAKDQPITVRYCNISNFKFGGIRGNWRWTVDSASAPSGGIFRHNLFHDIGGWGILAYDSAYGNHPTNVTMYNNIVFNAGQHLSSGGGLEAQGSGALIYNNTIFNVRSGIRVSNATVKNNIVYQWQYFGIGNTSSMSGGAIQYNIVHHDDVYQDGTNNSIWNTGSATVSNNTTGIGDPKFSNAEDSDYCHDGGAGSIFANCNSVSWEGLILDSNSNAIDAGTNLGSSHDDAFITDGLTWPPAMADQDDYGAGWEIGAFLYGTLPIANGFDGVNID